MYKELNRYAQLEAMGSRLFSTYDGAIGSGVTVYHDMLNDNSDLKAFIFADSIIVTNNSAQPLEFYLNGADKYYVPAYTILPINRPATNYKIKNVGTGATNANEIYVSYRRLPPNIVRTVQA